MAAQGAQPYLLPLLNQLQGVEETLTNLIIETVLKLQSLTETKVFLLLEASGGKKRRFCGAPELIDSFKREELSYAVETDFQVALDPNVCSIVEQDACDDAMFSETHNDDYADQSHPDNDELLTFKLGNSVSSSPTRKDKKRMKPHTNKPAKKAKISYPSPAMALIDSGLKHEATEEDMTNTDFYDHDSESFDWKQSENSHTSHDDKLETPNDSAGDEDEKSSFDPSPYLGNAAKTEEFKVILSGKGSRQLLTGDGWRYHMNRGPCGPKNRVYYECVQKGCPARAATFEDPNTNEVKLVINAQTKTHNHPPNRAQNDAKEILSIYRDMAQKNPMQPANLAFEEAVAKKGSLGVDPSLNLDEITFKKHKHMFYRVKKQMNASKKYRRKKKKGNDSKEQEELDQVVSLNENLTETDKRILCGGSNNIHDTLTKEDDIL